MGKLCFVFILTSFHLIADSSLKLYHLNLNFVLLDFLSFLSSPDIVSLSDIACKYLPYSSICAHEASAFSCSKYISLVYFLIYLVLVNFLTICFDDINYYHQHLPDLHKLSYPHKFVFCLFFFHHYISFVLLISS